jgi:hypothetical protein
MLSWLRESTYDALIASRTPQLIRSAIDQPRHTPVASGALTFHRPHPSTSPLDLPIDLALRPRPSIEHFEHTIPSSFPKTKN